MNMMLTSLPIKVRRWLMQPNVWRFVGFASTAVAQLCYALSSSFNHLFGGWNLWKICVYSFLSFIFCFAVLFAKKRQPPNSNWFNAHTAFFVVTVTSVYSFFYDKMVNEEPDAYSLISCAAFAVMSLSLSRQTHFGFEVDLLYFFLGAFIVQLMKIKLWLGIAGACFGYSLIVLRSSLNGAQESDYHQNQNQDEVAVPAAIAHITPKFEACMEAFMRNKQEVIDMLFKHVQKYMEKYNDPNKKDHIPNENNLVINALQSAIVNNLSDAVKLMVAAGLEKECCDVYSRCRREFLEEIPFESCEWRLGRRSPLMLPQTSTVLRFGLQKLDVEDFVGDSRFFLGDSRHLEHHIENWVETFHIAVRILFPNERRLCERIFSGSTEATDLAFMDVCSGLMIHLLDVANSFAAGSRLLLLWPKIPKVLETLHGLNPEFQSLFCELPNEPLRNQAINTYKRLEEAAKGIFTEFQDWIYRNRAMADFSIWINPMYRDAIRYLGDVSESRILLEKVFQENSLVAHREGTSSSLYMQTAKIMELLDHHLEVKSKNHANPALYYLFMTNNRWYIQQRVKRSNELRKILGDDWIQNHYAKVQQSIGDYQRSSWQEVLDLLMLGRNEQIKAPESMKRNLKSFNEQFVDICRTQSTWYVLDEELRKEIRNSLDNMLKPAYRKFTDRLRTILGREALEYIEYSTKEIDALLIDLFRGPLRRNQ